MRYHDGGGAGGTNLLEDKRLRLLKESIASCAFVFTCWGRVSGDGENLQLQQDEREGGDRKSTRTPEQALFHKIAR